MLHQGQSLATKQPVDQFVHCFTYTNICT
jgi:hypothetical protein